jgi:hypothetical protein
MFLMLQKSKNHLPKKILGRSFCMVLLLSMPLSQAAEKQKLFYHYVNGQGEPFIGTTIQPEYLQYGYTIKDINGAVIERVLPQKAASADEKQKQKRLIEQKKHENQLMRLYGSSSAAERTLKSNTTTAEIKIGIIESNLMSQKQKLEATESTIAEFQQTGQLPTPELIEKQKEEAERFLSLENAKKSAEAEKKRMIEKYEKDIKSLEDMEKKKAKELQSKKVAPNTRSH